MADAEEYYGCYGEDLFDAMLDEEDMAAWKEAREEEEYEEEHAPQEFNKFKEEYNKYFCDKNFNSKICADDIRTLVKNIENISELLLNIEYNIIEECDEKGNQISYPDLNSDDNIEIDEKIYDVKVRDNTKKAAKLLMNIIAMYTFSTDKARRRIVRYLKSVYYNNKAKEDLKDVYHMRRKIFYTNECNNPQQFVYDFIVKNKIKGSILYVADDEEIMHFIYKEFNKPALKYKINCEYMSRYKVGTSSFEDIKKDNLILCNPSQLTLDDKYDYIFMDISNEYTELEKVNPYRVFTALNMFKKNIHIIDFTEEQDILANLFESYKIEDIDNKYK
jgi:hypothetical protein